MNDVIITNDLTVCFPGCEALRGIDLQVPRGTVFALLGENGAGKTTLLRVLMGFLKPTRGTSHVLGLDPTRAALEIRRRVGYVSDAPAMYEWMRVAEIGWFAAAFYPKGFIERFRDAIARYEIPQERKIKHLSRGQKAKLALALALAHDPELLILDEPTSGVDPIVRREFLESMLDRVATGRTVLLSSHHVSEVERVADHVAILHQGKIGLCGSMDELRDTVSEVIVSVDDPLLALPTPVASVCVLSEQTEGRQRRLIVHGETESLRAEWESLSGVRSIAIKPATLEDVFAACVRGNLARWRSSAQSDECPLEQTPPEPARLPRG